MALKNRRLLMLSLVVIFSIQQMLPCYACGPFFPVAVSAYSNHPDLPLKKLAQGNLGILQPTLAMSYLVVAYRYLTNIPLNTSEQNAVISLWHQRLQNAFVDSSSSNSSEPNYVDPWLNLRNSVRGVNKLSANKFSLFKYSPATYREYTFCTPSAIDTAVDTLKARITKYGIDSTQVKFWLANQDKVFQNCGTDKDKHITYLPQAPADDADTLCKDDYAYQTAAANFYAENFDVARAQFEQIANNSQSPWHKLSAYLVGRTMCMDNIGAPDDSIKQDAKLTAEITKKQLETEEYLQGLLKRVDLADYHADIQTFLDVLTFQLHPLQRHSELVRAVLKPNSGNTLEQYLDDYTVLLDSFLASPDSPADSANKPSIKQMHDEAMKDDLTDWLFTFAAPNEKKSLQKWQATKSLPWLIAALSNVSQSSPVLPQLLAAADRVSVTSPAYLTVQYYAIEALRKSGKDKEAKLKIDHLLSQHLSCMTPSAHNMLLSRRQQMSTSLTESIEYALKKPVSSVVGYSYMVIPDDFDVIEKGNNYAKTLPATFDANMAEAINNHFSFSLWQQLAANKLLPSKIHNEVVASTWVRAILLGNDKVAEQLTPMLQAAYPSIKLLLAAYASAQDPIDKRFAACFVLLKAPGLSPDIRGCLGRVESNIMQRDEYGDNFWIPLDPTPQPPKKTEESNPSSDSNSDPAVASVDLSEFITSAQESAAEREAKIFYTTSSPPRFITEAVIAMSKAKPNDPRIPEALFIATKMPRWGCRVADSTKYSKAAFQLIHSKYEKSKWADRAQYYY